MSELLVAARSRGVRFWVPFGFLGAIVLSFLFLPLPILEKLRILSAGVCAQRLGHSILFGDVQPPLESRMIGIYGGFMVALLGFAALKRGRSIIMPRVPMLALGLVFVGIMGVDGFNAFFKDIHAPYLYEPDNRLRLLTGTLCGFAVAMLVLPILNYTLWRDGDLRPLVPSWKAFFGLIGAGLIFDAIVLTGWGFLLYPVSLLSVGGVLLLVVAINLLVVLSILRREGRSNTWLDLAGPGAVAAGFALAELLFLAGFRFWAEAALGITPL
jgi:hypothetical protein